MSSEALLLFVVAAVLLSALAVYVSARSTRVEHREVALAAARSEQARLDAALARQARAEMLADQAAAAGDDARGVGDGLGRGPRELDPPGTGRFTRDGVPVADRT